VRCESTELGEGRPERLTTLGPVRQHEAGAVDPPAEFRGVMVEELHLTDSSCVV
jgi:hypothetical protein